MSNLGSEYVTEFGEFIGFKSDARSVPDSKEPFREFISLSEIDFKDSPIYEKIKEIAEKATKKWN